MKKTCFLVAMLAVSLLWTQNLSVQIAHSQADWDAGSVNGALPPQGFRGWEYGYYTKREDASSFKRLPGTCSSYWGDGDFTLGAINRDGLDWSDHSPKYNVVRRWTAGADGDYLVELTGRHHLVLNGQEVSWGRKCLVIHNGRILKTYTFPGQRFLTESLSVSLRQGDRLDFVAHHGGSSLRLVIRISKVNPGLPLVWQGRSAYRIVIPSEDPGGVSVRGARLLQRVLRASTTVELAIVKDSDFSGDGPFISIGRTRQALSSGIIPGDLKEEETIKRIQGRNLFLLGVNRKSRAMSRGSYHWRPGDYRAVVSFLEQEVGARFLLPGKYGEYIPERGGLVLPPRLNVRHCPPFPYHVTSFPILINREPYEPFITASNSLDNRDMYYWYGHSHVGAVSPKTYGKTHPEYFAMQNGKRRPDKIGPQLCLSNPDVRRLMVETIDRAFAKGFQYYQVCQSDGFFPCDCEACKALGTPSERVWNLHLEIARKLYEKYPDRKLNILAYDVGMEPPAWIDKMPPNVVVELTKYDEHEFQKWKRFKVPHMVYDYNWGCFNELGFLPQCTPSRLAEQLKRYHRHGVICIFNCGYEASLRGLEAPATYAYGRLLDDLSLNPNLLVEDYCRSAFGAEASPLMYSFFSAMYKHLESRPENAYFAAEDKRVVRTPDALITTHFPAKSIRLMEGLLSKAEKLVTTPGQKMRLKSVRLHFDYVRSVVRALTAFHAFELMPDRHLFQLICQALREREAAIDAWLDSDLPAAWKGNDSRSQWLAGGCLSGVLGAPFTWNWKQLEKSGKLPLMQNKDAVAHRLGQRPTLSDPVWSRLPVYALEKVSGGKADPAASFQIAYDAQAIYLRFHAEVPQMATKRYLSSGREHYIIDECFDVFLNPTGLSDRYFQFIFSPAPDSYLDGNMNIGRFGADPMWNKLDTSWNGGWTYDFSCVPERNHWQALLTIPVTSLVGFRPAPGKFMTLNVGRVSGSKLFLWSPNTESARFGNTSAFGNVLFK